MTDDEMLAIKEREQEWLFRIPGVTGVGLARKRVGGAFTDTVAIIVYLEKKRPPGEVPDSEQVPSEIEGIPTDVIESPAISLQAGSPDTTTYSELRAGIPIYCGSPGTLSFIGITTAGYSRGAGRHVLVSNQHVLLGFTKDTEPGSAHSVGQPSAHGCCESCDFCSRIVGHVRTTCMLDHDVDAGVAELLPGVQWLPEVQDEPNPVPIEDIRDLRTLDKKKDLPFPVWKRGRTTGRNSAMITDVNYAFTVTRGKLGSHRDALRSIRIEPCFSDAGDSGAPIMDSSNNIVGILFAGEAGGPFSAACHIVPVTDELKVVVCTKKNTPSGIQTVPSVPATLNQKNTAGPPLPEVPGNAPLVTLVSRKRQWLYEEVQKTEVGRDFLRRLIVHREEIQRIARSKRVIVAWRRFGGADVTNRISKGLADNAVVVPSTYGGRAADRCAEGLALALKRYAGPELAADIDRYVPMVERLAGKTSLELLAALNEHDLNEHDLTRSKQLVGVHDG